MGDGQWRRGSEGGGPPDRLVEALEAGVAARLVPLLARCVELERAAVARQMHGEAPAHDAADDLANLNIIAGQIVIYERRWRAHFHGSFDAWPHPPRVEVHDAFSLVSDAELQAQLVGQPVIEALERRHADVLDTIDRRLWSLAATMGGKVRPANPFSPQFLVDSFLHAFPPAECGPRLRGALLRHFEHLAGECLADVYAWCNRQLADSGCALAGAGDYATFAATMAGEGTSDVARGWDRDAQGGQLHGHPPATRPVRGDPVRGNVLRDRVRARRQARAGGTTGVRHMRPEEFLAVLSLLQGEQLPEAAPGSGYARLIRQGLDRVAAGLGIDSASAVPSPGQEDGIELVGGLFDHLAAHHHLSARARSWLGGLVLPYLRLALADAGLFEQTPQPVPMRLLSLLVESWDGNDGPTGTQEAALHDLADRAAREVVDAYHGDEHIFERVLAELEDALEPLRRRAAVSERRAWQALEGSERLEAARGEADRALAVRMQEPLLPAVADFLDGYWRQGLVQAWLRGGPGSDRYRAALELGDAIVQLDRAAATAQGAQVATRLLDLQQRLQDGYAAVGLDAAAAGVKVAELVSELAQPDTPRRVHGFTPLAQADAAVAAAAPAAVTDGLEPGRTLLYTEAGRPARVLRLAWRSTLTGTVLLVGRQGTRELLLSPTEMDRMLAEQRLRPRPVEGPVEAALRHMEAVLTRPTGN